MYLNAVVLVLQEILEAAMLISVLMVLTRILCGFGLVQSKRQYQWLLYASFFGVTGAWLYAHFTPQVSQWFDYVGLEVVNSSIQVLILISLIILSYGVVFRTELKSLTTRRKVVLCAMVIAVALSIIREVSEIILYMNGILGQQESVMSVILGGLTAAGIGCSTGIVIYFSLLNLPKLWCFRISLVILALFAGNMAAQATQLMTQADLLPYSVELWDSSGWLPEYSVIGQLLYALVGYEATPSLIQAGIYLGAMLIIILSPLFHRAWLSHPSNIVGRDFESS